MVRFSCLFYSVLVFTSLAFATSTRQFEQELIQNDFLKGKEEVLRDYEFVDEEDSSIVGFVVKGDSCGSAKSCENCTALSKWYGECHWCTHDQACHSVGSVYGCAIGSSCNDKPPTPSKPDDNDINNTCYSQDTCRDCGLHSHLCHWCAHDNACHVIGSTSGCVTGVDCYDNAHCQRKEPELLPTRKKSFKQLLSQVGWVPLLILCGVFGSVFCCATVCCCIATGIKGAYDELAEMTSTASATQTQNNTSELSTPLLLTSSSPCPSAPLESSTIILQQIEGDQPASSTAIAAGEHEPLLSGSTEDIETSSTVEVGNTVTTMVTTTSRSTTTVVTTNCSTSSNRRPRSMQRLYSACVCCYLFVAIIVVTLPLAAIRYYPGIPVYNICNDSVAWQSLIDSLTRMKATADFEILASISNPNYLEVALDVGRGSFTHNGAFVGTFDIPPTLIAANSITDFLIGAHIQPDKWDALNLAAEYYSGKLVLNVDVDVTIRMPALMDYTFRSKLQDLRVNVNEQSDRTFCACPTWNDPNPPNKTIPSFMQLASK